MKPQSDPRDREALQREKENYFAQIGLSLEQRMALYPLQPDTYARLAEFKKTPEYKALDKPFKGYLGGSRIGYLVPHRKTHAHLSLKEWEEELLTNFLPYANFYALAERISKEKELDLQQVLNGLRIRIVLDTNIGTRGESETDDPLDGIFVQTGLCERFRKPTTTEEDKRHIDRIGVATHPFTGEEMIVVGIQVKPISFARYVPHDEELTNAQQENFRGQRFFQEQTGAKVYYLFHNALFTEDGRVNLFTLEEVEAMCKPREEVRLSEELPQAA